MPVIVAVLLTGLVQLAASIVGRVLIAAGVGMVSYIGFAVVMSQIEAQIWGNLGGVSSSVQGVWGLLKLGACINVVLSAYTIRMTLDGLGQGGAIKRWVIK